MKKVNGESVRYLVPKVKNRFLSVYLRFIILCAAVSLIAVTIALSFFTIRKSQQITGKPMFLFFCEVDDYEAAKAQLKKYSLSSDIYFVFYEDEFKGTDTKYDFSSLGVEGYRTDAWDDEDTALVFIDQSNDRAVADSYSELLGDGAERTLSVDQIIDCMNKVMGR